MFLQKHLPLIFVRTATDYELRATKFAGQTIRQAEKNAAIIIFAVACGQIISVKNGAICGKIDTNSVKLN